MKKTTTTILRYACVVAIAALAFACGPRKAEVYVTSSAGEEQFRFEQLDNADLRDIAPSEGNFIQLMPEYRRQPVYGDEPMLFAKFPHPLNCILECVLINIVGM